MRPTAIAILACLLAGCGAGSDAYTEHDVATLDASFARVRPAIEEVLGEPYGEPPRFVEAARERRVAALTAEIIASRGAITGGPRGEDLRRFAEERAAIVAVLRPLHLDLETGEVLFDREAFRELARLSPEQGRIMSVGFLDVLVMLESVLLRDHRRLDARRVIGAPAFEAVLACREAVLEGHAQYVGRRAIEKLEHWPYFDLMRNTWSRPTAELSARPDFPTRKEVMGRLGHSIVQGERFLDELVVRLGYPEGRDRAFLDPPRSVEEIRSVDAYLGRPPDPALLVRVNREVVSAIRREGFRTEARALALAELEAALAIAGHDAVHAGTEGVREAAVVTFTEEALPSRQIVVVIVDGGSEEGAATYTALHTEVLAAKAKSLPEGAQVLRSVEEQAVIEGGTAVFHDYRIEPPGGRAPLEFEILSAHRGRFTVEVTATGLAEGRDTLARTASAILSLLAE